MSTVSFGSLLRCGAFSADGPAEEPFLEPSHDSVPAVADLLRLRRRRAERLVPVPAPTAAVRDPLVDATLDELPRCSPLLRRTRQSRSAAALTAALSGFAATPRPLARGRAPTGRPSPDPGLDPHPAEQPGLGLAHDDDLGVPTATPS